MSRKLKPGLTGDELTLAEEIRRLAHQCFENLVFDFPAVDEALWSFDSNLDLLIGQSAKPKRKAKK